MRVGYSQALEIFETFSDKFALSSLHPDYVVADAKRNQSIEPIFFVFREGSAVYYHGFHLKAIEGSDFSDIESPYGYGGPIIIGGDKGFRERAWISYLSWCLEKNVLAEFIRFHPLLDNWQFYNGEVVDDRQTVWVNLQCEDLLASYGSRARTAVRKALKNGLKVEWESSAHSMEVFTQLYRNLMIDLSADEFYHFNDDYISDLMKWENAQLAVCKYEGEAIAGAIFLIAENTMEYHLSAASSVGRQYSATNLLIHEAAVYGQKLGCHVLYLGGGTNSNSDNPLLFFKSGFSNNRAMFKIGKYIHHKEVYEEFKRKWLKIHGEVSNRILFYRY